MNRRLIIAVLAAALTGLASVAPRPAAAQTFSQPRNFVASSLAATHAPAAPGVGTLIVQPGTGQFFGTPTPTSPIRVVVARRTTLQNGFLVPTSTRTIYMVTGRSDDTLTGLTVASDEPEANADDTYVKNDPVQMVITAGMLKEVQSAAGGAVDEATLVHKTGDETISGNKIFSLPIVGSVTGNAGTVTNGVYTSGSYADPTWITSLAASKLSGTPAGVLKGSGGLLAQAVAGTDYLAPTGSGAGLSDVVLTTTDQAIAGTKTFSSAGSFAGTLGIGTAAPNTKVEIVVVGNDGLRISNPGNGAGDYVVVDLVQAGGQKLVVYSNSNNATFSVPAGNLLFLPSGRIGFGTSVPNNKVEIAVTGNDGLSINNAGNGAGDYAIINLVQAGAQKFIAYTNSNNATLSAPVGDIYISPGGGDAIVSGKVTSNGSIQPITADSDAATVTFDLNASDRHTVTIGANRTFAVANASVGQQFTLIVTQGGTGSNLVTWWSGIRWSGGSAPILTTTVGKADVFTFLVTAPGVYFGFTAGQNF